MHKSLDWLEGLPRFSKLNFNLYRSWLLLKRFVPEYNNLDVYFITGSKGKGTVAATLAAILRSAGINTGLVTSPHLINITERLNYNGLDIEQARLAGYLEKIACNLPELQDEYGTWIHSEILNVAALMWIMEMGATTVVLEAGMGGRLDPGNVFRRPLATCISTVALEHKGILGNTVEEIAGEKAGVTKPGTAMVTAASAGSLAVISQRANRFGAPLYVYGQDFRWEQQGQDAKLVLPGGVIQFKHEFETDAGRINKAMAACLAGFHPLVREESIIRGLGMPGLPGRFEVHMGNPTMVLDVAHTPESVDNLLAGLIKRFPGVKIAFVAGFLADKPWELMLQKLLAVSDTVFYAPIMDSRGYNPNGVSIPGPIMVESIVAGLTQAGSQADVVCVTGSFAAVREARILLSNPN